MPKLINTKYGYVTPQEAETDAHLDKWMKRRAKKHGVFNLHKGGGATVSGLARYLGFVSTRSESS